MSWSSASRLSLTVVVPAYQVETYLPQCLESLLTDLVSGVEVVVVDDRSPDRSGEIADRYARVDTRLKVLHLATNVGLGRARNAGLERARGRYVWFVDGDDWVPPGTVPAILRRLATTAPDVLVVDHAEVWPDGRTAPGNRSGSLTCADTVPGPLAQRPELLGLAHTACTKVIRRGLLNEIDLRFHPGWYEDSAFTHALLLAAPRIDTLDRVCYCYRQRTSGAITGSVSPRHFDVFQQYGRLWSRLDSAGGAYDWYRPDLFRLMVDHLLVIAGNERRLPPWTRRAFFARVAQEYHRRLPPDGYPVPGGMAGLKHRLVRWNAYRPYAALRVAWRASGLRPTFSHGKRLSDKVGRTRVARRARDGSRTGPAPAAPAAASGQLWQSDSTSG